MSDATKHAAALQAGQRMVARGERPGYRLTRDHEGTWTVDGLPWLSVHGATIAVASVAARVAIATWLDVAPEDFDVDPEKSHTR